MQYMIKSICLLLLAVFCAACSDEVSNYTTDTSNTSGTIRLDYLLDDALSRSAERADSASSVLEANELIWIDITGGSPELKRIALAAGENVLVLPKGAINLVGFVHNPVVDRGARSISSAIQGLGGLKLVGAGLNCSVPVADSALDVLDLGTLSPQNGAFYSAIADQEIATSLGYDLETLEAFGAFDLSLMKILNPDVDGNGVYDIEENRKWMLTASRSLYFYLDDFDQSGPLMPLSTFFNEPFALVFWLNGTFAHPDYNSVFLELPAENIYTDFSGGIRTGVYANWHGEGEGSGGEFNQYYFNRLNRDYIQSPDAPYNGTYRLFIGDDIYTFSDISFVKPTDTAYEGFVFPQTILEFDPFSRLQKLEWRWWIIKNGAYVAAAEDEVRLLVKQFYYYLPDNPGPGLIEPIHFNLNYYQNGAIDLSSYGITRAKLGGIATEPGFLRAVCWDRAGNEWNFNNSVNSDRP